MSAVLGPVGGAAGVCVRPQGPLGARPRQELDSLTLPFWGLEGGRGLQAGLLPAVLPGSEAPAPGGVTPPSPSFLHSPAADSRRRLRISPTTCPSRARCRGFPPGEDP